jgi:hypothetical protein
VEKPSLAGARPSQTPLCQRSQPALLFEVEQARRSTRRDIVCAASRIQNWCSFCVENLRFHLEHFTATHKINE